MIAAILLTHSEFQLTVGHCLKFPSQARQHSHQSSLPYSQFWEESAEASTEAEEEEEEDDEPEEED